MIFSRFQLQRVTPNASMVAAWTPAFASSMLPLVPNGKIWFSPRRIEKAGPFGKVDKNQSWRLASRRQRRRTWNHRSVFREEKVVAGPLPDLGDYAEMMMLSQSLASK